MTATSTPTAGGPRRSAGAPGGAGGAFGGAAGGRLDPEARRRALDAMATTTLDVLVVGGGVVGAGAALDAATRGLSVGLVEARDWAAGTSSRSSKLVHGGLRYLEMLDFRLVREALVERGLLLQRLAPHLVRPVQFLYPLEHHWERPYVGAGLLLYDTLSAGSGWGRGLPRHRHLTRSQALRTFPSLRPDSLVGAVTYWDAQVDDARHTMTVVRTAAAHGALVANRAKVVRLLHADDGAGPGEGGGGPVVGAEVLDVDSGQRRRVRARQVVSATGVWTEDTQDLAGPGADGERISVRAAKGVHLVVPGDRIEGSSGLILRTEKSVLFVIPWGARWIIGTTDTDWELDRADPAASAGDIGYLLDHVNRVLRTRLVPGDILGVYAGLRPLLSAQPKSGSGDGAPSTAALSREHTVASPTPGLVVVAGGKYTTYRVMAADAIDVAVAAMGGSAPPSCTESVPVVGADGWVALCNSRGRLAQRSGLDAARIDHLLGRYGSLVHDVLALVADHPELGNPLPGADGYLAAEVVYACRAEGALHLDDVLVRRTRISFEGVDRGASTARAAAVLMAAELGWDAGRTEAEIDGYLRALEAERRAEAAPDDRNAAAAATSTGGGGVLADPGSSPDPAAALG